MPLSLRNPGSRAAYAESTIDFAGTRLLGVVIIGLRRDGEEKDTPETSFLPSLFLMHVTLLGGTISHNEKPHGIIRDAAVHFLTHLRFKRSRVEGAWSCWPSSQTVVAKISGQQASGRGIELKS